jgi:hypothetical protein
MVGTGASMSTLQDILPKTIADVDTEIAGRRFNTCEEAKASWVRAEVPDSVVKTMIENAQYYNLDFSDKSTDQIGRAHV